MGNLSERPQLTLGHGQPDVPEVVAGYDGSETALAAVVAAAEEALLRRRQLRILHVVHPSLAETISLVPYPKDTLARAGRMLGEAVRAVRLLVGADGVTTEVVVGRPVDELVARSEGAELVVVGRHGAGGLPRLLGSVADAVVAQARCPVLVAHGPRPHARTDRVVAGVDRPVAAEVLPAAFAEAEARNAALVPVRVWHHPQPRWPGDALPLVYDLDLLAADEARALARAVQPYRDKYPGVPVEEALVRGRATAELLRASEDADLLVVGAHRPGVSRARLGSVGRHVVRHASCPVLVARAGRALA